MSQTVDYVGYQAKLQAHSRPAWRRALGRAWRVAKVDLWHNTLLYPYGAWQHARLLRSSARSQGHTYTCFRRAPLQLAAVAGPVLEYLRAPGPGPQRLRVLVFACSNGAEAYTLAATLLQKNPRLELQIEASDLHQEMIDKASAGRYSRDEVLHSPYITPEFVAYAFDAEGEHFVVKPALRERVQFGVANLLDPALPQQFEPADLVLAQNVLFHLPPAAASQAFEHISRLLRPKAVLMIEGMDLALKVQLTRAQGLQPLGWRCRDIYEQSRAHVSAAWWRYYYGSEPYALWRSDRLRRYSSIFLKGPFTRA